MPNVLIVVDYDIQKEIIDKEFLEIMSPLEMAKIEGLNLLDNVEDVAKADIGPMNVDR